METSNQSNREFKRGDVVMLKSGGPPMTVTNAYKGHIIVVWFDKMDRREVACFEAEFLDYSYPQLSPDALKVLSVPYTPPPFVPTCQPPMWTPTIPDYARRVGSTKALNSGSFTPASQADGHFECADPGDTHR